MVTFGNASTTSLEAGGAWIISNAALNDIQNKKKHFIYNYKIARVKQALWLVKLSSV